MFFLNILAADVLTGTEVCYRGCGRYYHYTIKCCTDVHKVKFSQGNWVKYIVQRGQLFFDKCTAFSLMNKISIVKHCDFRTVDRYVLNPLTLYFDVVFFSIYKVNLQWLMV